MHIPEKYFVLLLIITLGISSLGWAQNGGQAGSFSRIGFGPRGMAMGNALTSVTDEGIYSYYNPALAAHAHEKNQIDIATAAMSFDRNLNTLSATFQLPPSAGLSVSIINANVAGIDGRDINGYNTGTLKTHEYQLATALGLEISDQLSVGIGLKYFIADYHTDLDNAATLGLNLGLLYSFSDRLNVGVAARDLLAAYTWDSGSLYGDDSSGRTDDFPTQFRLGASYHLTTDWLITLEGGRLNHENKSSHNLRIGSAYDIHERITVRVGWQFDNLSSIRQNNQGSAGFSVHLPFDLLSPSVDYAFIQEQNSISYMHTFGLRLNL